MIELLKVEKIIIFSKNMHVRIIIAFELIEDIYIYIYGDSIPVHFSTTRGQAVARIADRTASQQTLLISDCCMLLNSICAHETSAVTSTCSVVDCHITPLLALTSRLFWSQSVKNTSLRSCRKLITPAPGRTLSDDAHRAVFQTCDS